MSCNLCSCLVVDFTKAVDGEITVPFSVQETYPGLNQLTKNARDGCDFCDLLVQLLTEYFDVTESGLKRPVYLELRNSHFYIGSWEKNMSDEWQESDENGVFMLAIEFTYEGAPQLRNLYFAVYSNDDQKPAMEKDPHRRKLRQPLEEDPLSTKSVAKMRGWIHDCGAIMGFARFRKPSLLPASSMPETALPFNTWTYRIRILLRT